MKRSDLVPPFLLSPYLFVLDSANKKYVDESSSFKKVKVIDNSNLSFTEQANINFGLPSGFTVDDLYNIKFILYEFYNITLPSKNGFYAGNSSDHGFALFNAQQVSTLSKFSVSIPIYEKMYDSSNIFFNAITPSTKTQVLFYSPNTCMISFYCIQQVTGKFSAYFIM